MQVTILDRALRAHGVRVAMFNQQQNPKGGGWVDAQVDPHINTDSENAILTRARQLRIAKEEADLVARSAATRPIADGSGGVCVGRCPWPALRSRPLTAFNWRKAKPIKNTPLSASQKLPL